MKGAVIYFSLTGNNKKLAAELSKKKKYDLIEFSPGGLLRIFQMVFKFRINSKAKKLDIRKYNDIIICGPVWAFLPAPAVQALINNLDFTGKTLSIQLTHTGGNDRIESWVKKTVKSKGIKLKSLKQINIAKNPLNLSA